MPRAPLSKPGCGANWRAKCCSMLHPRALRPMRRSIRSSRSGSSCRGPRTISRRRSRSPARRACRYCRAAAAPRNAARPWGGRWSSIAANIIDRVSSRSMSRRGGSRVSPGSSSSGSTAQLRQHKLFFPVDVSTGDRATIGGMTANNSCGSRSIRYGNMVHNVRGDRRDARRRHRSAVRRGARQFR